MKRIFIIICAALLFVSMPQKVQAQEPDPQEQSQYQGRRQREQPDPEKLAEQATDKLNEIVGLSKKQYKKVYKFQFQTIYDAIEDGTWRMENNMGGRGQWNGGPRGPRPDGQRPDMAQRPDGQRPDGQRPQRPQLTDEEREARMAQRKAMMEERQAQMEKIREAEKARKELTEQKYQKILTPEQYEKWQAYEAEQAAKREQRMKEMQERREQQRRHNGGDRPQRNDVVD